MTLDPGDDFNWNRDEAVTVPEQLRLAVYQNPYGAAVIRQERQWDDDGDTYIVIQSANALAVARAILEAAEIDATITVRESRPTALLPPPARRCPSCGSAVDKKGVCPTCSAKFKGESKVRNSGTTKPVIVGRSGTIASEDRELFADADQPAAAE